MAAIFLGLAVCGIVTGWGWVALAQAEAGKLDQRIRHELGNTAREESSLDHLRRQFAATPTGSWVDQTLKAAHLAFSALDGAVLTVSGCALLIYVSHMLLGLVFWQATLVGSLATILLLRLYLRSRRGWFVRTFSQQLPDVAWTLGNAVRAGLTVPQAIHLLAREAPLPSRKVFADMAAQLNLNRPLTETLAEAETLYGESREFRLLLLTVRIQYRSGGNLARALEVLAQTLAERKGVNEEVHSATAGARSTATILPIMPVLIILIMNAAMPGFIRSLFSLWGLVLVIPFLIIQWIAYVITKQLSDVQV